MYALGEKHPLFRTGLREINKAPREAIRIGQVGDEGILLVWAVMAD